MTTYRIVFTEPATDDIIGNMTWWAEHRSGEQAERWYDQILVAIQSLSTMPLRCPLAKVDEFGNDLRGFLFGVSGRPTHRVFFELKMIA